MEAALQALIDRQEITELLCRGSTLTSADDVRARLMEMFTDDGVDEHHYPTHEVVRGREAIIAHSLADHSRSRVERSAMFVTNVVIDLDGDVAEASYYSTAWHWLIETAGEGTLRPVDVITPTTATVRLRRTEDGWRVTHRVREGLGTGVGRQDRYADKMVCAIEEAPTGAAARAT